MSDRLLGGKIYAVGGYNAGNLNTNEEYDPALNAWTTKAQMGAAREYLSAAAVGGKLYALGGSNGVSVNEAYDPVANTWATKAPLPTARANLAAAAVGGKIYTLGGGSGPYLGKTEEYDPATDTWSTKALMLTARGDLAAAVVNNKIYAIGGTNGPYLAVNEEYDPVLNLWTTRAPLPEVRLMPGAAAVGGKVLAVSGYSSGAVSATAEYDPAADAWSVKASILTPRYGMGVAAVGGKVYALGGAGGNNLNQEYIPGVARVFTGLQPNTLYTFKSKARNQLGVETSESITVSTYTLAAVGLPANAQPIAAVYASSAAVNWSSGTGTAFNGPGASFLVVASTSPDYLGTNVSSHTYNVAVATLPLASNTSYYFRIQAYNAGGMTNYSWLALGSTVTLASTPAALPVTAVSTWTITAAWGANGNAPDTVYRAEVSHSPGFAPLVYSTSVADTWVDLGPLPIANTYYFMRVNAVNRSGSPTNWVALGSTVTAIEAPLGVTFTAVSSHTLQTQAYSAGVGGVFTNLSLAQSGIDQALGGGWQGWEQTDSHVFTGLAPNAPYAAKARARNALWAETPETLEFSTYTLATVSLPQAGPLFQAVYLASATVAWSSGTALTGFNGPGASYIIQASTAANFSGVIFSSRTAAIAAGVDLERNTSYYFRAQAYNAAGVTDYSWLVLGSTATQIETPSGIDFTAVTATSIDVLVQGQPGFSNLSTGQSSIAKALNGVYAAWFNSSADSYTGLTPNTQYAFSAKARNQEGRETPEVARSTWTLAATPAAAQAFNNVYTNTLWAFWQANGNPVGTLYRAEVSTAADFSGTVASSETVNLYGVMFGLQANTTYYGRVAAVNGAGVYSPYLALGSTITYIQAPTAVYADEVTTNSVTMSAYASDFTGLERGLSAVRLAKDGVYEAWGSSGNYWAAGASLSANTAAGAAAALGGKVHLAGGWAGGAAYVTHRAYDPAVNAWADRAPLLTGRHSLALAAAGNKLYAVGGAEGLTNLAVNEEYDPEANAWTAKAPMPTARKELAAAAAGGKIYALGGSNGSALAQNEEYDPAYNRWTARTPMPTARYGLAAAVIDGQVYASGGAGGLAVNEEYDPAVDAWVTRAPLLTGRYNHGAAAVGGKLYAVGGYNGAALALNESYDPATNNWTTAAPLPAARYKIAVAAAEGRVYALGGVYVTTNEVYDPGVALAFSGLAPNTQYSFKARARNQQGTETGESVTVTTYTLAAVALSETGTTFVEVFPSSVAVAWSSGTASGGYNGPNPSYKIQASTAPDFTGTLVTPHLYSPVEFEYAVADLASNTTYHFRIQAWNAGGFSDYRWLSLGTTVTHAIIPNAAAQPFDGVNQEGVTIQWGRNGNSEGTAYKLQVSSHTNFSFVHSTVYPLYASTTAIGGLTPNTTWYARAAAVSYSGVQTDYYVIGGTLTHSAAPSQVLFSAVSTRTVTVEAYSSYGFPNLAEGLSGINQAVGGVYAGWLQSTGTVFGGLAPNTSFAFKAKARNQTGIETAESLEFSTYTLATVSLPQQTSLFSGVWLTSVTVNWSSGTVADGFNGPGADHHVEVSRDVAFTQIANGAATYNLSWSPEGLWPNTTHYFKARAVNTALVANPDWLTLGSTSTLANTVPSASVFEVWPTTVTVDWAVLPPVPSSDTCEGYLVQASTATDFTGLIKSSATGDNALGSLVVLNLFAETTYYFRVGALNHNGVPNYALAGSTWTPSENIPPTINNNELATDYTWYGALPARTYNIDFHDTGGSALENFQVRATTGPLETGAVNADWMDILTGINADDYTVNWPLTAGVWALLADGTNYISVQVFDGSGNKAAAQDAFMVFKDTTPPSISETYDDQIWRSTHGFSVPTAAADPHSGINKVQYSARSAAAQGGAELIPWSQIAAPGGAKTAAPALPVSSGVWDLLQSGTNYFSLRAWDYSVPVNTNTWTDAFVILKDTTPPAAMTTLAVVAPSTYSLRVSFEAPAEGPSGIDMFGVQYATYAVAWATSSVAGSTHSYLPVYNVLAGEGQLADIVGLGPNTTYYFRAWARDQAGNWSAASNAAEGVTLAEAPQVLGSPDFYTSTAAIAWIPVDSNGYAAYASTASDFSGTVLSSATPAASAVELVVPGLLPGTTYYLKAASLNWSGVPNYTGTYTDSTFVVVPASAAVYTGVSSVSITVEWLSNGNGPGTQYFVDISSENFLSVMYTALVQPSGPGPHSREFTSMLQPNTTYWFQVLALGNRGDASDWLLLGSTVTAPVPPALTGYALWSSSAAVAWTSNGNGAGTLYQADLSTASDFSGALLSSSAADAFSFSMGVLTPNTTYYLRLRAVSAVTGMASPYVNDVELALAAEPASIGAWTVGANNIGVFWDADGNPGVTAQSAWQTGAALPAALYGHAGAIAGDFAFITGGYDGGTYKTAVWSAPLSADGVIGAWTQTRPLPGARYAHSSVAMRGRLYVIGGYDGSAARAEVWSAPISSSGALGEWVAEAPLPQAVYAHAFTAGENTLYVLGGYNNAASDDVWYTGVNPDGTLTGWTAGPALSEAVYSAAAYLAGPNIYLAGGYDGTTAKTAVWRSPVNGAGAPGAWLAATALPSGVFAHALDAAPGALFISGGTGGTFARASTLRGALNADGTIAGWHAGPDLPAARQSHLMFTRGSRLTVLGGYDGSAHAAGYYSTLAGTEYRLYATGAPFAQTPWQTAGWQDVGSLTPNSSYVFRPAARNYAGLEAVGAATCSTFTYAAQPGTAAISGVYISSMQANWLVADNPAGTLYQAQLSSDGAHTQLAFSSATANAYALFAGIEDDYAYYARVRAVNAVGVATAWTGLGWAATRADPALDFSSPTVTNNQAGDNNWRKAAGALYDLDFADMGGSYLDRIEVRLSTAAGGAGPFSLDWTAAVSGINAPAYADNWALPAGAFELLAPGTSYVSVRAFDGNGNSTTTVDAFYILKDTVAPVITNYQAGEFDWRMDDAGPVYDVDFADGISGLGGIEYSASPNQGSGDAAGYPWTAIAALSTAPAAYNGLWAVDFAGLPNDATNYISVRAWDLAGNTVTVTGIDVFRILKYVAGPETAITAPAGAYVSALTTLGGTASDARSHALAAVEVSLREVSTGKYWDGADFLASSVKWFVAAGTAAWSHAPGITWLEGSAYQAVARSSDTAGNYSLTYATRSFTFDSQSPVIGPTAPADGGNVNSVPAISGTAYDLSGLSALALRLSRLSDGKWWDFGAGTWTVAGSSATVGASGSWSYAPGDLLRASLEDGASYYYTLYAADNSVPARSVAFGVYGSTFGFTDDTPPAAITDLTASTGSAPGNIQVNWTSPGDDGASGMLLYGAYRLQYSTMPAVAFSTADAQAGGEFTAVSAGSGRSKELTALVPGETYYLRAWTLDDAGNWSALSNGATAQASPFPDRISGRVMTISSAGITGVLVEAYDTAGLLQGQTFTVADGSGSYAISGLPSGSYRIQATWTADDIVSSVGTDGVALGASNADFLLSITYDLASIGGELPGFGLSAQGYRAAGARPRAASVELYQRGRLIATAPVDAAGRFLINNLLPGKYTLRVPKPEGGVKELAVSLKAGEALRISPLGDILRTGEAYAYPNPASRVITFRFETDQDPVLKQLAIFDITGRLVHKLADGRFTRTGAGPFVWKAEWEIPSKVASGVYVYTLHVKSEITGEHKKTVKKFAIVK